MSPVTHFLTGWLVANASEQFNQRERTIITLASVVPDLDGIGIVADFLTSRSADPLSLFSDYHHILGHNIGFGIIVGLIAFSLSVRRRLVTALALSSFHLHLLCDLVGSRGPDGYQWPIPYLLPFSNKPVLSWSGQWELNAWPNVVFTSVVLAITFVLAWKRGYSPLEMVSDSADRAFVETLRRRFPVHAGR